MNLHLQEPGSNMCGHCVVAMFAGCHPREVRDSLQHARPTTWRELYSILFAHGVVCEPELVIALESEDLPERAVIRLPGPTPTFGHWVAYADGLVYCPVRGRYHPDEIRYQTTPAHRAVKYAKVTS